MKLRNLKCVGRIDKPIRSCDNGTFRKNKCQRGNAKLWQSVSKNCRWNVVKNDKMGQKILNLAINKKKSRVFFFRKKKNLAAYKTATRLDFKYCINIRIRYSLSWDSLSWDSLSWKNLSSDSLSSKTVYLWTVYPERQFILRDSLSSGQFILRQFILKRVYPQRQFSLRINCFEDKLSWG